MTIAHGVSNVVTIAATQPNASETGPVSGQFTFTRTGPTTFDLPVNFNIGGTATNFFDYQTIVAGDHPRGADERHGDDHAGGRQPDRAARDGDPDPHRQPDDDLIGAQNSATVTIADGVSNVVTIAATDANASETVWTRRVHLHAHRADHLLLAVNFNIGGTASNFFDYQTISSQVIIPAGQASATVTITPVADGLVEPAETVILTITPTPATYLVGAQDSATVTITDQAWTSAVVLQPFAPASGRSRRTRAACWVASLGTDKRGIADDRSNPRQDPMKPGLSDEPVAKQRADLSSASRRRTLGCPPITHDENGAMHVRPMTTQRAEEGGIIWMFMGADSHIAHEIAANPSVLVTYADTGDSAYVAVRGHATAVRNPEKAKEMWSSWPKPGSRADRMIPISRSCASPWRARHRESARPATCRSSSRSPRPRIMHKPPEHDDVYRKIDFKPQALN